MTTVAVRPYVATAALQSEVAPTIAPPGVVSLSASGIVIPAVATKRLKVYRYSMQSRNDGMTVQFTDGNGGANLSHIWSFNAREGAMPPATIPDTYHFATSAGVALYAVITGTGTVDIDVGYWDTDSTWGGPMTLIEAVILVVQVAIVIALVVHHRASQAHHRTEQRDIDKLIPLAPPPPIPKPIYAGLSLHCGHTHAGPQTGTDGLMRCPLCHVEHLCQR